ncbi:MAG: hypothetical protein ACK4ZJ_20030, partial [Allorhizobium sp.]
EGMLGAVAHAAADDPAGEWRDEAMQTLSAVCAAMPPPQAAQVTREAARQPLQRLRGALAAAPRRDDELVRPCVR